MKKSLFSVALMFATSIAQAEIPVSVLSFKNKVGSISCQTDWPWWEDHLGSAFQDMLITELGKNDKLEILERANIQRINDEEVNLVNSAESEHKIEKGHFKKAKYTIVGTVSSYEYCAEKKKINVGVSTVANFLGVSGAVRDVADTVENVGIAKANAKVVIDLRVVDAKTGRIVKTVRSEGKAERSNFKIQSTLASYSDAQETPVGEAARDAIEKAAGQLVTALK